MLDDLQRLTRKVDFFNVAMRPAKKFLADGRNAHLIQQPLSYWLPLFWERFTLLVVENGPSELNIIVASRLEPLAAKIGHLNPTHPRNASYRPAR